MLSKSIAAAGFHYDVWNCYHLGNILYDIDDADADADADADVDADADAVNPSSNSRSYTCRSVPIVPQTVIFSNTAAERFRKKDVFYLTFGEYPLTFVC